MRQSIQPNRKAKRVSKARGIDPNNLADTEVENLNAPLLRDYLTPDQLASELGLNPETLKRWRRLSRGPPVTLIGRQPYYHRASVIAWMRSQEIPSYEGILNQTAQSA
jgi:hypothetical protein